MYLRKNPNLELQLFTPIARIKINHKCAGRELDMRITLTERFNQTEELEERLFI